VGQAGVPSPGPQRREPSAGTDAVAAAGFALPAPARASSTSPRRVAFRRATL